METSIWLLISVLVMAVLIILGAIRAPDAPGRKAFTLSILFALSWTAAVLARHSSSDLEFKIWACKFAWFGIIGTPLYWSLSFLTYARGRGAEKRWQLASIGLISAAFGILALTNDWHNWMYIRLIDERTMLFEHGWLYQAAMLFAYSAMAIAFVLGLTLTIRARGIHRWQLWALLASAFFPLVGNVSYTAYGFTIFNDDPTPFIFAATGAFMLGAQLFGQLFVLPPIGRDAIFEVLPDPVIVLDAEDRILELNPAAATLPGMPRQAIGSSLATQPEFAPILQAPASSDGERSEIKLGDQGIFEVSAHSLTPWGRRGGRMIVMRDISLRKAAEERMAALSRDLEMRLHENVELQNLLREEASRDHLTGLYNRRHAQDILPALLQGASARDRVAVTVVDIDHFKLFNDRYGHQTGDTVLKLFAKMLTEELGDNGQAFRWGGEEFLVILPDCDRNEALVHAARWQQRLCATYIPGVNDLALTFSGGLFVARGDQVSLEEAVKAADTALYAAKAAGRNRMVTFGEYAGLQQPEKKSIALPR
ncbi:diguanylate cyclase [Rhizobium sp. FKY42]|uniref:GGDEF domain-containing protein n=1 Tax=Rhizobium sp. FKY42 TaxID=2562310 RepID=UPI0010C0F095|nr:diguanylate cyclase [Rhizobium sp. FKY42]